MIAPPEFSFPAVRRRNRQAVKPRLTKFDARLVRGDSTMCGSRNLSGPVFVSQSSARQARTHYGGRI